MLKNPFGTKSAGFKGPSVAKERCLPKMILFSMESLQHERPAYERSQPGIKWGLYLSVLRFTRHYSFLSMLGSSISIIVLSKAVSGKLNNEPNQFLVANIAKLYMPV